MDIKEFYQKRMEFLQKLYTIIGGDVVKQTHISKIGIELTKAEINQIANSLIEDGLIAVHFGGDLLMTVKGINTLVKVNEEKKEKEKDIIPETIETIIEKRAIPVPEEVIEVVIEKCATHAPETVETTTKTEDIVIEVTDEMINIVDEEPQEAEKKPKKRSFLKRLFCMK